MGSLFCIGKSLTLIALVFIHIFILTYSSYAFQIGKLKIFSDQKNKLFSDSLITKIHTQSRSDKENRSSSDDDDETRRIPSSTQDKNTSNNSDNSPSIYRSNDCANNNGDSSSNNNGNNSLNSNGGSTLNNNSNDCANNGNSPSNNNGNNSANNNGNSPSNNNGNDTFTDFGSGLSVEQLKQSAVIGSTGVSAAMSSSTQSSSQIIGSALSNSEAGASSFAIFSNGQLKTSNKNIHSNSASSATNYISPFNFNLDNYQSYNNSALYNFKASSENFVGKANEEDSGTFSTTIGMRYQSANPWSDSETDRSVIGLFASYSKTEVDIGSTDALSDDNVDQVGNVALENWGLGVFGVLTSDRNYLFGLANATFGEVEAENSALNSNSSYDVTGFTVYSGLGRIVDLGSQNNKVDLRTHIAYIYGRADAYSDTQGVSYGVSDGNKVIGGISAKFYSNYKYNQFVLRPFLQVGGNYTILDEVDLDINDTQYIIKSDDEASLVGRVGFGFSGKNFQGFLAAEGEVGENVESYQIGTGLTFKLN